MARSSPGQVHLARSSSKAISHIYKFLASQVRAFSTWGCFRLDVAVGIIFPDETVGRAANV